MRGVSFLLRVILLVVVVTVVWLGAKRWNASPGGAPASITRPARSEGPEEREPKLLQARPLAPDASPYVSPVRSDYATSSQMDVPLPYATSPLADRALGEAPVRAVPGGFGAGDDYLSAPAAGAASPTHPISSPATPTPAARPGEDTGPPPTDQTASGPSPAGELPSDTAARAPRRLRTVAQDSFWALSQRAYGTGRYYRALYAHNADRVEQPDRIPEGLLIETPGIEFLRERYPRDCPHDNG